MDPNVLSFNNNNLVPISLTNLEKQVEDISGNVVDLKKQVDVLIKGQAAFLDNKAPPPLDISMKSVS